ncbi:serine threonine- kinase AFC2 isoform X3 [Olea europaea subsp. europaea]|uniref:Serine threonine- kinase AFC2 isoform X3 n=1 Tax=Olea europaea subsp. europaea TaxID=158383 RepID=A0A8S0R624_OLEEU|nr:serine threonine- kinase AFC2 isoform X3 [Olea europaea subsp. europaea]
MHDLHLIHTDLKPENILLFSSEYIKVPNYKGSSRSLKEASYYKRISKSSTIKGEALFQTHENLEHLAMMDNVLRRLPQQMLKRTNRHAKKYVRRDKLDWPEGVILRDSIKAVSKFPRLQNLVMQHVDHSGGDLIHLLQGLFMILMKGCQLVRPLGILSSPRIISEDFEKNGLDMHFMAEDEAYLTTIQCMLCSDLLGARLVHKVVQMVFV